MAVRAGTTKPDVSSVEGFKQALLQAKTVAIPGSTGGIWLTHDLFPRLGITEKINIKVTPRGTDATGMVAGGGADLAVLPVKRGPQFRECFVAVVLREATVSAAKENVCCVGTAVDPA